MPDNFSYPPGADNEYAPWNLPDRPFTKYHLEAILYDGVDNSNSPIACLIDDAMETLQDQITVAILARLIEGKTESVDVNESIKDLANQIYETAEEIHNGTIDANQPPRGFNHDGN